MAKCTLRTLLYCTFIGITLSQPILRYDPEIKNPCKLAKQRKLPKNLPIIRVIDELTGENPDVLLGQGGIRYFMLPPNTPTDVVIECSSSLSQVEWVYRGRGASSGLKVVNTRWSSSTPELKASCHSSAIVISNITDQLTGEYTCKTLSTKSRASQQNDFLLFVPQTSPFYYKEGETVNVTVLPWVGDSPGPDQVVLPCISRRRSGAGISLYQVKDIKEKNETTHVKLVPGPNLKFNPFVGFQLTPSKEFFEYGKIAKFICKFDNDLPKFGNLENRTLLNVNLVLQSDEKISPEHSNIKAFSPYFSWTTKQKPRVKLFPDLKSQAILWQQYFTKDDYEETSSSATVFHLGSIHLVNISSGSEGTVILYDGNKTVGDGLIHKWHYNIFDKASENIVGLSYEFSERMHIFTCISATEAKPNITFMELFSDEIRNDSSENPGFTLTECPKQELGCVILTTVSQQGEVTCNGDGVHRTIRFPYNSVEPTRPFFIERGETITVLNDDIIVTLPCLPNAPEAQYAIYLFKKSGEGYELLWSADEPAKASEEVEFYPNWGFHIDTSYAVLRDPTGEYVCTSSKDISDRTDAITVIVKNGSEIEFTVTPKESEVYGALPFTFRWESKEDLEIKEDSYKNVTIQQINDGGLIKWKFILLDEMTNDQISNLTLIRISDKKVVHSWKFHKISTDLEKHSGLKVDTDVHENGEHSITLTCRSKSKKNPAINYFFCQSPSSCDLMKRCSEKNCNPNNRFRENSEPNINETQSCLAEEGCSRIKLVSVPLNGFLKVFCNGDGVKEQKTISDVFFREDIHWDTEEDDDLIYLYVSSSTSTDQNPQREIRNIGTNVDWEIGDTIVFTCAAAPFLFSNGIKWAVETKDGVMIYHKDNIFDPQFKYSGRTQVLSSFTLLVDSFELSRVWCFVPTLGSNKLRNVSQPIYIKPEIDENCHETDPSIRLVNIYPPLSKTKLDLQDPRLDKIPFFVLPSGTKQFAVRVTTPEPVDWIFTGYGAGPSMTPLIQTDRQITDFYDTSTYCYSSKFLANMRFKNSNDTGRYVAKYKYQPEKFLSFYLFVPSNSPPYILKSGLEVNETWAMLDKNFYLPCLVNNPQIKVELFRKNVSNGEFEIMNDNITYDPTVGFIFLPNASSPEHLLGTYKCIANNNSEDFIIVNVQPQAEKKGDLKYEKVGEIHIFTCLSATNNKPVMNFTSLDGRNLNSTDPDQINEDKFTTKECPEGCLILMTTSPTGKVNCIGDGVEESYRYPTTTTDDNIARNVDKKTGLWFDPETNAFKCQTNSVQPPTLVAVTCRRPNECEVMQNLLRGQGDLSQSSFSECGEGCGQLRVKPRVQPDWHPNWFSVFVRCKGDDNMEIFSQYFQDKNETVLVTMDMVDKFRKIRMDVVSFRQEKGLVHAKLRCFANRYFYSRGFQWALEKQNGAFVFKDNLAVETEVQNFSSTMSEINLDFDESIFKAVWCFVPMLDSTKWANSTISVPIDQLVYDF